MAKVYRVCSGNTSIDITVTLVIGACNFWYDVYNAGFTNEYYRQLMTVNLSQASPVAFTYNYNYTWSVTKNGDPFYSGYGSDSVTIPQGVTTYSWYRQCKSIIGSVNNNGGNPYIPQQQ